MIEIMTHHRGWCSRRRRHHHRSIRKHINQHEITIDLNKNDIIWAWTSLRRSISSAVSRLACLPSLVVVFFSVKRRSFAFFCMRWNDICCYLFLFTWSAMKIMDDFFPVPFARCVMSMRTQANRTNFSIGKSTVTNPNLCCATIWIR